MKENQLKKTGITALFWVILSLLILGGATFAWFTFTSYTNVKPMTGSVGNGGADLQISSSEDGPFSNETELIANGTTENLQPVSTANQNSWFSAVSHNSQGISTVFQDVTEKVDDLTMYGTVYLQSNGGACDVYFDADALTFGEDQQLLASCRIGMILTTQTETKEHIFHFDSFVDSSGLETVTTTEKEGIVIASIDGDGAASFDEDPAESFQIYEASVAEDAVIPGEEILLHLEENEIARVDWRIYMEGCDVNCINTVQNKEISMNLAFAGVGIR